MTSSPFCDRDSAASPVVMMPQGVVAAGELMAAVVDFAAQLPEGRCVLNLCEDRYGFLVGFGAALYRQQVTYLPADRQASTLRGTVAMTGPCVAIVDRDGSELPPGIRAVRVPQWPGAPVVVPTASGVSHPITWTQVAVVALTSGSSGAPVAHEKTWGALVLGARAAARRFEWMSVQGANLVATVPAPHMYGLETSVLLPLQARATIFTGRPFYPEDVAAALSSVPAPRVLITTPVHLKALCAVPLGMPPLAGIVSATAPLSRALARDAQALWGAPVVEIYGCTEVGSIATRRTAETDEWTLYDDVSLLAAPADGPLVVRTARLGETPITVSDLGVQTGPRSFILGGRMSDLVNIAGKRFSLGALNLRLNAVPGVIDGAFYVRDDAVDGVARLAAFVVAPGVSEFRIMAALRGEIDPLCLPRPLRFVARLPRNATGKLVADEFRVWARAQLHEDHHE